MKYFYGLIIFITFFATSCNQVYDNAENPVITPSSLYGTTFTDGCFFITIENSTTVSFYTRDYPDIKGKAEYKFRHGIFEVINPHGRRLATQEVTEPYILYLEGTFTLYGKLDCDYYVVGRYEKAQIQGGTNMWKLTKN